MRGARKAFYTLLPCIVSRPEMPLPLAALAAVALADDAQRMQQGEHLASPGSADVDAEAADSEADCDRVRRPLRLRTALSAAMGAVRHSTGSGGSGMAVAARYLAAEALVRLAAEEAEGVPLEDADRRVAAAVTSMNQALPAMQEAETRLLLRLAESYGSAELAAKARASGGSSNCSCVESLPKGLSEPQPVPAEALECQLCLNLLYCPVTTRCGHTFCKVGWGGGNKNLHRPGQGVDEAVARRIIARAGSAAIIRPPPSPFLPQTCLLRALDHAPSCPFCRTALSPIATYTENRPLATLLQLSHAEVLELRRQEVEAAEEAANSCLPIFVCMTVCGWARGNEAGLWTTSALMCKRTKLYFYFFIS